MYTPVTEQRKIFKQANFNFNTLLKLIPVISKFKYYLNYRFQLLLELSVPATTRTIGFKNYYFMSP